MKSLLYAVLIILLSCGLVYALGDKNHGTKGKGTVTVGTKANGQSSQDRTGR